MLLLAQELVDFVMQDIVLPAVNKMLVPGIPLPAFPGLAFTSSVLSLNKGFALIGLDFTFTPTA